MNRDDILRMAREQGLPETEIAGVFRVNSDDLGRMLAAEREACARMQSLLEEHQAALEASEKPGPWPAKEVIDKAVAAEREACARVCETLTWEDNSGYEYGIADCAAAIRARGER